MSDNVDEQLNIRLSKKDLIEVHKALEKFGCGMSQSNFGRIALKVFIAQLEEKGALVMLAELIDK